jgi:hypothetical protein
VNCSVISNVMIRAPTRHAKIIKITARRCCRKIDHRCSMEKFDWSTADNSTPSSDAEGKSLVKVAINMP